MFVLIKKESETIIYWVWNRKDAVLRMLVVYKMIILLVDLQKALFGIETQITEKNYLLGGSI